MDSFQTILLLAVLGLTGLVGISLGAILGLSVQRRRETT